MVSTTSSDHYRVVRTATGKYHDVTVREGDRQGFATLTVSADQAPDSLQEEAWEEYVADKGASNVDKSREEILGGKTVSFQMRWDAIREMW